MGRSSRCRLLVTLSLFGPSLLAQASAPPHRQEARPPMVLPLDYTTPQPAKIATAPMATPDMSVAQADPASVNPAQPHADLRPYDTSRFPRPDRAWFAAASTDGKLWAGGANWKASFDATGFEVHPFLGGDAPTNYPVRLQLTKATVAGRDVAIAAVAPTHTDHRAMWQRGGVIEYVDITKDSLEQSFRFDRLPTRGELVLDLSFQSELTASTIDGGITFRNALGGIDYTHAVAIDARGERLPLAIELRGAGLAIRVPAAFVERATLPLIVDPVLVAQSITPGSAWEGLPDLAYDDSNQEWFVVWNKQYSATDMDVWAQRLDVNMSPIGSSFTIDYTADYWFAPRVANQNAVDTYLVVSEVSVDGTATENWWIAGARVGAGLSGLIGPQFHIERDGVVGLPGRNFLPAVGGDPSTWVGSYFTVVWAHETSTSNYDIHLKQIDSTGNLRSTTPTVVDGSPTNERYPDISKGNGDLATGQRWVVVYQRTFSPLDEDIRGALVTWDGQIAPVGGLFNFSIDASGLSDSAPHASTPTDRSPATNRRYSLLGYSRSNCTGCSGTWGIVTLLDDAGWVPATNTLYGLGGAMLNVPSSIRGVDSDGSRFAVAGGITDVFFGNPDNFIATVAFDVGQLTAPEVVLISNSPQHGEYAPAIQSAHSSGAPPSPRYGLTYGYSANGGNSNIAAGLYVSPFPDECTTALPLVAGVNGPFTAVGSTTSLPSWGGCAFNINHDVWFSYVAPATVPVTFWTCTPTLNFDTVLQVFVGSCGGALVSLGCNDDFCSLGSRVSISATAGTTYYVRVGGYNGTAGAFDVEVQPGTGLGSIVRNVHGCGPTSITASGQPRIGGSVTTTLGNVTGIPLIGLGQTPTAVPFCGCTVGHDWLVAEVTSSYTLGIPLNVSLIGAVVATQGAEFLGVGGCASPQLTLTDTMVITIG